MKICFAPFHGLSNRLFRDVWSRHFGGVDLMIAPFIAVGTSAVLSSARFKDVLPQTESVSLIPQLIGSHPQDVCDSATFLHNLGFERVNWNLGCPMPQITRKKRGCGLMPYPDVIEETVCKTLQASDIRLSIKMRLGMYACEESLEIIRRLNGYPLDFMAIHARLGEQRYSGQTDKAAFRDCLRASDNPIFYNGDICSLSDYERLRQDFPNMKTCLIGRGLLSNPFLAEEIRGMFTDRQQKQVRLLSFLDDLILSYQSVSTPQGTLNRLKELCKYFSTILGLTDVEIQTLLRINDLPTFEKALQLTHPDEQK